MNVAKKHRDSMILNPKTVIILGAGAGVDLLMPSGENRSATLDPVHEIVMDN